MYKNTIGGRLSDLYYLIRLMLDIMHLSNSPTIHLKFINIIHSYYIFHYLFVIYFQLVNKIYPFFFLLLLLLKRRKDKIITLFLKINTNKCIWLFRLYYKRIIIISPLFEHEIPDNKKKTGLYSFRLKITTEKKNVN